MTFRWARALKAEKTIIAGKMLDIFLRLICHGILFKGF
jgi:hypothetical protein